MKEETQGGISPTFTKSEDGYLVGGPHPELGDMVYAEDGETEIGRIVFFYDRIPATDQYRVKVQEGATEEDPLLVEARSELMGHTPKGEAYYKHWLVAVEGAAAQLHPNLASPQVNVAIENNTEV
jgi:hypothetical protein